MPWSRSISTLGFGESKVKVSILRNLSISTIGDNAAMVAPPHAKVWKWDNCSRHGVWFIRNTAHAHCSFLIEFTNFTSRIKPNETNYTILEVQNDTPWYLVPELVPICQIPNMRKRVHVYVVNSAVSYIHHTVCSGTSDVKGLKTQTCDLKGPSDRCTLQSD